MNLPKTFQDILDAIEESMKKDRLIPVLILVYAGIDNISNLAETNEKQSGTIFREWVKKWMLEKHKLPCNETDIWAARCGLLHQQISESNLTKDGKAREIFYSHGGASPRPLQMMIALTERNAVNVVVEDLIDSFKNGMIDCLREIERDPEWKKSFESKASKLFITVKAQT